MHKLFLTLVATVFVSSVAVVSEAAPPVAEGAIPSGYVWLSGPGACDSTCPPTVCTSRSNNSK
jgi:hypothetical protein